jgi:hypothetical protein
MYWKTLDVGLMKGRNKSKDELIKWLGYIVPHPYRTYTWAEVAPTIFR